MSDKEKRYWDRYHDDQQRGLLNLQKRLDEKPSYRLRSSYYYQKYIRYLLNMLGVILIGLFVAVKLDFITLDKTKLNSIRNTDIELVISTTDATNVSKVYRVVNIKVILFDLSLFISD